MTFLSEGTPSLDQATRVAKVRIEANDAPHGVVEFAQSSYNASEGRTAYILVSRKFGTSGDIRVFYRFVFYISTSLIFKIFSLGMVFRSPKIFSSIVKHNSRDH